jgi:DNA-binding NarL/FixJ family response regulator
MAKILIVDSRPEIRKSLCATLAGDGGFATCSEAETTERALELSGQFLPDLVIFDLASIAKDHISFVKRLQMIVPKVAIFMLTDKYDSAAEKRAIAMGITAVFSRFEEPACILANAKAIL